MITKFLQSFEDPDKPFYGPNFWILTKTGLILPENKIAKALYILMHEIVAFFVFTQYIELYIIRSNLDLVLTNLRISMLSVVCVVKANTFVFWQEKWNKIIDYLTEADSVERYSNDPERKKIIDKYTNYSRRVTYTYWVLVFITLATTIGSPFIHFVSASYRESLRNGTELFPHILSSWMPIDKNHSPGIFITIVWHFTVTSYGALIMSSYDTSIMVIMVFFGGKLDVLRERCKQMLGTGEVELSDDEVAARVRELHNTHVLIMKHLRLFDSVLSPVMFVYVVMCSLMLCASAYQLTSATNAAQKLLMAEYLIFGIAQLFIFCWHSNDVLVKSENVMLGPYESRWWDANVRQRKSILLLAGQLRISKVLSPFAMENQNPQERSVPIQYVRGSRAFRQFKNPPQPHMCIQDTIKDTTEKLFINVLGWQKIANPKQYNDPIPLYGGMQVPQGCGPNSNRPPLLVFAVMVNPDILKANGKNATNPTDREALVSLLCDFVEAMNPGLLLTRSPVILKDRDLAGELKDVWLAVQNKREREKGMSQDVMYKVYDIDGIGNEDINEEDKMNSKNCKQNDCGSPNRSHSDKKNVVKSSKQILMNAGQKSEFDSGMNNCQLNQNHPSRDNRCSTTQADTTYCTPVYGQIVSSRENHNQINDIQQKFSSSETTKPSSSFRKDWNPVHGKTTEGWDEFSKRNISSISKEGDVKKHRYIKNEKDNKQVSNGKSQYDFFPVFDNKASMRVSDSNEESNTPENSKEQELSNEDNSKIILDAVQKLVLQPTDNKLCDNKTSALSSISS
ncbi:LOW QUALITY PROTEIN: uncharacterized protein LOC114357887 [Ostrinia furnacalis]|uniref:LOW QUALITY PROTEIN: uncharacterized protein LOC114357887 n=1 Tax=Ostrinia furnacalis TaxID=93504 RepID=UPI00103DC5FC|nr:LOW QUALITY PROTEIN: uncharacterized protein LOC114357887 [Ostrinia furnacalis]